VVIPVRSATRNKMSLIAFGQASASTHICIACYHP
jgi:hypothetical protein